MAGPLAPLRSVDVRTPDGRTLHVYDDGEPGDDRVPVLVHHGTPSDGSPLPSALADARERGLRLVGVDRPGYGGSDRRPDRSVADIADDAETVADALGLGRLLTWGTSGGGPHALACAVLLPERVVAAALVSGVAPYGVAGLDWLAGMGEDNVEEYGAAMRGEQPLREFLEVLRRQSLAASPQTLAEELRSLLPPVDLAAMASGLAEHLHASMVRGLEPGYEGWLDDDLAYLTGWELDLDALRVPVLVVAGGEDLMVPYAHGHWLAAHVPGAEASLLDDEGHLSLLSGIGRVHAWLLERWTA
jgi:pimeloyl-ACP methyl ester carboxylesterase